MKRLLLLALTGAIALAAPTDLVAQMTLEEKLGQLQQRLTDEPATVALVRAGRVGSTLSVLGAARCNRLQRVAVEESRLKIPLLFGFDVIHGYRTIFPVPLGEAASWDPAMAELSASVAAREAYAAGLRWTFAPMVDVARDPRWGRVVEGAGEDPVLVSAMARARVRGFQGTDYSQPGRVVACAKHFVAYGAVEAGRDYNSTDVSERTLREVYLPPFKTAVDAGVGTLMSAFTDLGGVPGSANVFTLDEVLRREWKFDGFVVSDYSSVEELIHHGIAADGAEAAELGLNAGVDMEMVSENYNQHGAALLAAGKVTPEQIEASVRRILLVKQRAGLWERPYTEEGLADRWFLSADHRKAARRVAVSSMVLLRNERNRLPIPAQASTIALLGPLADSKVDLLGSWEADGKAADVVTVREGIQRRLGAAGKVLYAPGPRLDLVQKADYTVLVVGEPARWSGEARSRSDLSLPADQVRLIQAVHATRKPYCVVLMNGRPLVLGWVAENCPALLEAWYPGTEGGNAVADVLFGDQNPGGKLPMTFPRVLGQVPIYYNHKATGRSNLPPDHTFASKYLDVSNEPQFPFGYGLSYTTFELSNLKVAPGQVEVTLTNTGLRAGDEVVQVYLHDVAASVTRPVKELKAFQRVTLGPGQQQRLTFPLGPEQLALWDRSMHWRVEPGVFTVTVGTSSEGGLTGEFRI